MKKNNKGFTLAELLVVVAIIGILVAISIPIFTSQMEKSRDSVTVSNLRTAYAEAQTAKLAGNDEENPNVVVNKNDSVTVKDVEVKGKKEGFGKDDLTKELPFTIEETAKKKLGGGDKDKYDVTFTTKDGKVTASLNVTTETENETPAETQQETK